MREILLTAIATVLAVNMLLATKVVAAMLAEAMGLGERLATVVLTAALTALVLAGIAVLNAIQASV
jgi:hypothetical protein